MSTCMKADKKVVEKKGLEKKGEKVPAKAGKGQGPKVVAEKKKGKK